MARTLTCRTDRSRTPSEGVNIGRFGTHETLHQRRPVGRFNSRFSKESRYSIDLRHLRAMSTDATPEFPQVFISHASEDKGRFVEEFATQLRSKGVDAWFDRWEMQAGDSLVKRIFECGIAAAQAFVVVLSHASVSKPWVREELDAAVVRRINSGGVVRLIPVVLDADVDIPAAVQHLLWLSVDELAIGGVVDEVVRVVYGGSRRPALGPPPAFSSTQSTAFATDTVDDLVFRLVVEEWKKHGLSTVLMSNGIQAAAEAAGVSSEAFVESVEALVAENLLDATPMAGRKRWRINPLPDHVWLRAEEQARLDLLEVRRRVLSLIINDGVRRLDPAEIGLHEFTVRAIARQLESEGLISVSQMANRTFLIGNVSALARRALRG